MSVSPGSVVSFSPGFLSVLGKPARPTACSLWERCGARCARAWSQVPASSVNRPLRWRPWFCCVQTSLYKNIRMITKKPPNEEYSLDTQSPPRSVGRGGGAARSRSHLLVGRGDLPVSELRSPEPRPFY